MEVPALAAAWCGGPRRDMQLCTVVCAPQVGSNPSHNLNCTHHSERETLVSHYGPTPLPPMAVAEGLGLITTELTTLTSNM